MSKLTPHIWFDNQSKDAAAFYVDVFPNSKITYQSQMHDTPSGDVDMVNLSIDGHDFMFLSAGPLFKANPSISFTVACESKEEADMLWNKLSPNGKVMMPLQEYPFSPKYGWVEDKFGLSWQISFMPDTPIVQKITPSLLFTKDKAGKAEEAIHFYTSLFPDSKVNMVNHYEKGSEPNTEAMINFGSFQLAGQQFIAMDSAVEHEFTFNEGISIMVNCEDQSEVDKYWEALSAVPESEQCGWLKDKYGVSWQIIPKQLGELMSKGDQAASERVTQAFLKMKKFDIAGLEKAFKGE